MLKAVKCREWGWLPSQWDSVPEDDLTEHLWLLDTYDNRVVAPALDTAAIDARWGYSGKQTWEQPDED